MENSIAASKAELSSLIRNSPVNQLDGSLELLSRLDDSVLEFASRLKSYRRWSSKPVEVSPWWCSRYGWYCIEKDLLQCVGCRSYLSAHLPSAVDDAVLQKKAVNRLRASLADSHTNTCKWRSEITPEESCSPNISDYELALTDFTNRLNELSTFFPTGNENHYLVNSTGFEEKVTEAELIDLIGFIKTSGLVDYDVSREACIAAILGWRKDESCKECIRCEYCLRRVGLWLFRPDTDSRTTDDSTVSDAGNTHQHSPNKEKRLDPVGQHHKWCPWVMSVPTSSALFMNTSDVSDEDSVYIPTWLALFRLLTTRLVTVDSESGNMSKEKLTEHYVLARQLLNEALESIEPGLEQADTSDITDESTVIE